jgi:hypothetical protein
MKPFIKPWMLLLLVLFVGSFGPGCVVDNQGDRNIPRDRVIFIEHLANTDGEIINGTYPYLYIDFPMYDFDSAKGTLYGYISFPVNDSLIVVYGDGVSRSGQYGTGMSTLLYGGYSLPYKREGLSIISVDTNGTAILEFKNTIITLREGERWENSTQWIETDGDCNNCTMRLTRTEVILNHGTIRKAKIVSS